MGLGRRRWGRGEVSRMGTVDEGPRRMQMLGIESWRAELRGID